MMKVFYWSPFLAYSKIATIAAVTNSAKSLLKYNKQNKYSVSIINAIGEWNVYKENIDKYSKIIKDLGFEGHGYQGSLVKKTDTKHIYVDSFEPHTNKVTIRVIPISVGWTSDPKYKYVVDVDDIVNYVQSDQLEFS